MEQATVSVLLVEDNDLDVRRVERGFQKLNDGRAVVRARDGVEAIQILHGETDTNPPKPPFVVMLDLNLPRMGGLEFLARLREDNALRTTPVFVLTTSNYHVDINKAHEKMISGYLLKPDSAEEMVSVLKTLSNLWDSCIYTV